MPNMPCSKCGTVFDAGDKRCPKCGQSSARSALPGFIIIGVLLAGGGFLWLRPSSPATATPVQEPKATSEFQAVLDESAETTAKREVLIEKLKTRGVFYKVKYSDTSTSVFVGPAFSEISVDDKTSFLAVVLAASVKKNPSADILVLYDWRSGKKIGSFTSSGLSLD